MPGDCQHQRLHRMISIDAMHFPQVSLACCWGRERGPFFCFVPDKAISLSPVIEA